MIKFLKSNYIIISLILVAFFARFYNLLDLYYFMMDEERDVFIASNILKGKLTLLGGSVPGGLFLGPLYYYLTAVVLFFSNKSPIGLSIFASVVGVASVILLFHTVNLFIKDKIICFFASLFYASSCLVAIYNRAYWPLTYAPFVTILTINFLYRIIKNNDKRYIIPLGVVQLVGLQTDPSNISSFIVSISFFLVFGVVRKFPKQSIIAAFLIVIMHLPLVLFDLRHNHYLFNNVAKFIKMKTPSSKRLSMFSRLQYSMSTLDLFFNTFSRTIYINGEFDTAEQITAKKELIAKRDDEVILIIKYLCMVLTAVFVIFSIKSKNLGLRIITTQLIVIFIGIMVYVFLFPGYLHEWFLNVFWPGFAIIFVYSLFRLLILIHGYIIAVGFCVFIAIINLYQLTQAKNSYGYVNKLQVIAFVKDEIKNSDFSLEGAGVYNGFEYPFRVNDIFPKKNLIDDLYRGWLYEKKENIAFSKKIVVILPTIDPVDVNDKNLLPSYRKYLIKEEIIGGYRVLIVDNSTYWR